MDISTGALPGPVPPHHGHPAFFDGPQGVKRLRAATQRLHVDFGSRRGSTTRARCRCASCRSPERLLEVGAQCATSTRRENRRARSPRGWPTDARTLVGEVTGELGGKVGVAPRLFLRKLVRRARSRRPAPGLRPARTTTSPTPRRRAHRRGARGGGHRARRDDIELDLGSRRRRAWMAAIERLRSPEPLQHPIVHDLGWRAAAGPGAHDRRDARRVQLRGARADGRRQDRGRLLPAPLAHGRRTAPVSVLYVSPIRALLNNQEARADRYARMVGLAPSSGTATAPRATALPRRPGDILLTTPESLEVMMMSRARAGARLFAGLRRSSSTRSTPSPATIAVPTSPPARTPRRASAAATSSASASRRPSATRGHLRWVQGAAARTSASSTRAARKRGPELELDFVGSLTNAALVIAALHPGKKRLVFVDSRRGVEELGTELRQRGVDTFVTHSLCRGRAPTGRAGLRRGPELRHRRHQRPRARHRRRRSRPRHADRRPRRVAAFLQRMGRTGRRPGTVPNCTFLATNEDAAPPGCRDPRAVQSGFVEPIRPSRRAPHPRPPTHGARPSSSTASAATNGSPGSTAPPPSPTSRPTSAPRWLTTCSPSGSWPTKTASSGSAPRASSSTAACTSPSFTRSSPSPAPSPSSGARAKSAPSTPTSSTASGG